MGCFIRELGVIFNRGGFSSYVPLVFCFRVCFYQSSKVCTFPKLLPCFSHLHLCYWLPALSSLSGWLIWADFFVFITPRGWGGSRDGNLLHNLLRVLSHYPTDKNINFCPLLFLDMRSCCFFLFFGKLWGWSIRHTKKVYNVTNFPKVNTPCSQLHPEHLFVIRPVVFPFWQ